MIRRYGVDAQVYLSEVVTDNRGNAIRAVPEDAEPITVRMLIASSRSSKAEVPGQVEIDVLDVTYDYSVTGIDLWCRVEVLGAKWDIVSPPQPNIGGRRTSHWSTSIRKRPS